MSGSTRELPARPSPGRRPSAWSVDVHPVRHAAAQPLDPALRATFEGRFGRDLSGVRVHTDAHAAASARALGAAAYTVGRDVVFGAGRYDPGSATGRRLITHELAHAVQQDLRPAPALVPVAEQDAAEQQATALETEGGSEVRADGRQAVSAHRAPMVQRSLLGGAVGGILGGLGGAVLGALAGGPVGAVIGGVVGLVAGALIGDDATTRRRKLTATEITYAKDVFRDTVDYSEITITRDSMLSTGAPKTLGNTIHLRSDWGHFVGDTLDLTEEGRRTLIHEMGHVWQYQNGGLAYIPESLWAQFKGWISGGSRNAAYGWREADRRRIPWEKWNPEQQAQAIEDYNIALRASKAGTATLSDIADLAALLPYMQKVWARAGAPHFETPRLEGSVP